jgi:hypothetical protein
LNPFGPREWVVEGQPQGHFLPTLAGPAGRTNLEGVAGVTAVGFAGAVAGVATVVLAGVTAGTGVRVVATGLAGVLTGAGAGVATGGFIGVLTGVLVVGFAGEANASVCCFAGTTGVDFAGDVGGVLVETVLAGSAMGLTGGRTGTSASTGTVLSMASMVLTGVEGASVYSSITVAIPSARSMSCALKWTCKSEILGMSQSFVSKDTSAWPMEKRTTTLLMRVTDL